MRAIGWFAVFAAVPALAAGCAAQPRTGVVTAPESPTVESGPRDIPFRTADGQTTTFARVRRPIAKTV